MDYKKDINNTIFFGIGTIVIGILGIISIESESILLGIILKLFFLITSIIPGIALIRYIEIKKEIDYSILSSLFLIFMVNGIFFLSNLINPISIFWKGVLGIFGNIIIILGILITVISLYYRKEKKEKKCLKNK